MNFNRLPREPLHQKVATRIRSLVSTKFRSGQRLPSESQFAREFHVSVRTVREALSALAQEGLVQRRHGSGTYVAPPPPRHVALWLTLNPFLGKAEYAHTVLGLVHRFLAAEGISVRAYTIVGNDGDYGHDVSHRELLLAVAQNRVSGIGLVAGPFSDHVVEVAGQRDVPIVWNNPLEGVAYSVSLDVTGMIQRGTYYLLGQGCRKIAYMGWHDPSRQIGSRAYHAFEALLRSRGLNVEPQWVRGDLNPTLAGAGYEEFREIWTAREDKPDGLLVADDVLFRDVAVAILELGIRVPEQLKVVAHANKGMATAPFFPAPRLEFDPQEYARAMAGMLARLARREPVESPHVVIGFQWVECYLPSLGGSVAGQPQSDGSVVRINGR